MQILTAHEHDEGNGRKVRKTGQRLERLAKTCIDQSLYAGVSGKLLLPLLFSSIESTIYSEIQHIVYR